MSYSLCRVIRFKIYHISLESSRFRIFVCQRAKIPKQSTEGEERLKVPRIKAGVKRGEKRFGKSNNSSLPFRDLSATFYTPHRSPIERTMESNCVQIHLSTGKVDFVNREMRNVRLLYNLYHVERS